MMGYCSSLVGCHQKLALSMEKYWHLTLCTHLDEFKDDFEILVCINFEDKLDLDILLVPCKKKKLEIRQKKIILCDSFKEHS